MLHLHIILAIFAAEDAFTNAANTAVLGSAANDLTEFWINHLHKWIAPLAVGVHGLRVAFHKLRLRLEGRK